MVSLQFNLLIIALFFHLVDFVVVEDGVYLKVWDELLVRMAYFAELILDALLKNEVIHW